MSLATIASRWRTHKSRRRELWNQLTSSKGHTLIHALRDFAISRSRLDGDVLGRFESCTNDSSELLKQDCVEEALATCLQHHTIRDLLTITKHVAFGSLDEDSNNDGCAVVNRAFEADFRYFLDVGEFRQADWGQTVFFAIAPNMGRPAIHRFMFERVPNGFGDVYLHPQQCLLAMNSEFQQSIFQNAAYYARNALPDAFETDFGIRVSVVESTQDMDLLETPIFLDRNGEEIPTTLSGPSAGGAALYGLYHAFQGKKVDERVLVMTQCPPESVGELEEKSRALILHNSAKSISIDTVIVHSDDKVRVEKALDTYASKAAASSNAHKILVKALSEAV